ncbi:fatty acid desaturase family protein [Litoribacillus peritrichatus]|uniref:Fatty acid desaturase family protein n=1 Tax=Litoribacillus peritrichatus TaxID=718191 RepID=A0ABP7MLN5_9GAMM
MPSASIHKNDYLSSEEIQRLKTANNKKAAWGLAFNWIVIGLAFFLVAFDTNPLTLLIALILLSGRQLGLGIILHDCSHRSWFATHKQNDFFGHWLAGIPILVPMRFYRPYHFVHHTKTGTKQDPDVDNIKQYPVTRASMQRKIIRDFAGLSGLKAIYGVLFFANTGRVGNTVSLGNQASGKNQQQAIQFALANFRDILIFHGLAFGCFVYFDHPWLYGLWWLSYIFTYPFIIRLRQIAEHGAMPTLASKDVRETTRTTLASWWERLTFAPNYVNYHCEHHFLPTVPGYHLPEMHHLLKNRGFYQEHKPALVEGGYLEVLRLAASAKAD